MYIRNAAMEDLNIITEVEALCFPETEAAKKEDFAERIKYYGNYFFLMFDGDKLIAFIDGMVTDNEDLEDEMYEDASLHNEDGNWQMIFGLNTIPEYRKKGYAGKLIEEMIAKAKTQGRKGLVLTCKDHLIHYYAKFGFRDEGISVKSTHGNVSWHQMRLVF